MYIFDRSGGNTPIHSKTFGSHTRSVPSASELVQTRLPPT